MAATQPVISDVHKILDAQRAKPVVAIPPSDKRGSVDPLRAFERDALRMNPDLMHWMTFDEDARITRVEAFADKKNADRHRDLNYIIWRETQRTPDGRLVGSQEVAVRALRRLFNLEDPKVAKAK